MTTTTSNLEITPVAEVSFHNSQDEEEVASALQPHYKSQTPVVLRGVVSHAPAIQNWTSLDYLRDTVGSDASGYVEIGGTYGSSDMERPDIPFEQYIDYLTLFHERHGALGPEIDPWMSMSSNGNGDGGNDDQRQQEVTFSEPSAEELVYMAQNDLFPSLYKDVIIPNFCEDDAHGIGHGRMYSTMLWLGPRGCVSPLHFDPLDNIFMQYVGRKRVTLFSGGNDGTSDNSQLPWHYAGSHGQQYNTSPINIEDPLADIEATYPMFSKGAPPAHYCLLYPGDCLYIPSKWWHHVRSIDTCASVNVWWR